MANNDTTASDLIYADILWKTADALPGQIDKSRFNPDLPRIMTSTSVNWSFVIPWTLRPGHWSLSHRCLAADLIWLLQILASATSARAMTQRSEPLEMHSDGFLHRPMRDQLKLSIGCASAFLIARATRDLGGAARDHVDDRDFETDQRGNSSGYPDENARPARARESWAKTGVHPGACHATLAPLDALDA